VTLSDEDSLIRVTLR